MKIIIYLTIGKYQKCVKDKIIIIISSSSISIIIINKSCHLHGQYYGTPVESCTYDVTIKLVRSFTLTEGDCRWVRVGGTKFPMQQLYTSGIRDYAEPITPVRWRDQNPVQSTCCSPCSNPI